MADLVTCDLYRHGAVTPLGSLVHVRREDCVNPLPAPSPASAPAPQTEGARDECLWHTDCGAAESAHRAGFPVAHCDRRRASTAPGAPEPAPASAVVCDGNPEPHEEERGVCRNPRPAAPAPNLDRCASCSEGVLDSRLGGMCGDWTFGSCPPSPEAAPSPEEWVSCPGRPEPHKRGFLCVDPAPAPSPAEEPKPAPSRETRTCHNNSPPWYVGRWRDWHRGHGCDKDDGQPRTPQAQAEIDAHAHAPASRGDEGDDRG